MYFEKDFSLMPHEFHSKKFNFLNTKKVNYVFFPKFEFSILVPIQKIDSFQLLIFYSVNSFGPCR